MELAVELNTMYSINAFFHTHMYTHMRIYCINLHNGKQTSESYRRGHSFTADEARQEHDELVCRP